MDEVTIIYKGQKTTISGAILEFLLEREVTEKATEDGYQVVEHTGQTNLRITILEPTDR